MDNYDLPMSHRSSPFCGHLNNFKLVALLLIGCHAETRHRAMPGQSSHAMHLNLELFSLYDCLAMVTTIFTRIATTIFAKSFFMDSLEKVLLSISLPSSNLRCEFGLPMSNRVYVRPVQDALYIFHPQKK